MQTDLPSLLPHVELLFDATLPEAAAQQRGRLQQLQSAGVQHVESRVRTEAKLLAAASGKKTTAALVTQQVAAQAAQVRA